MKYLQAHSALHQFAIAMSAVFSGAFLMRQGLTPVQVFLTYTIVFALRAVLRPLIFPLVPAFGMKRVLIAGTILIAGQYFSIAFVKGLDAALVFYIVFTAFANMLYWVVFHPVFTAAGDRQDRGRQLGVRQVFAALASIIGPIVSGYLLRYAGPLPAFGAASLVTIVSALPLLRISGYPIAKASPPGAWRKSLECSLLYVSDGFLYLGSGLAWGLVLFQKIGGRFDSYGLVLALAAAAGALASLTIGKSIDLGHGRIAVLIGSAVSLVVYAMRALVGDDIQYVLAVVVASTVLMHLMTPATMAAFYNEAKNAPCPFRVQFAAETGWDIGAVLASLAGAAMVASGLDLQSVVWLAWISVICTAVLVSRIYIRHALA